MAGTNPQLAIRIAANTAELKRNLAEGKAAIEALGPSVAQMAQQWAANGAKVIQNANNITAALQGVNLGTLSAADSSKNLRALDLALAQLKASGQPIPPLMQQTATQLRALGGAASGAATPVTSLMGSVKGLAGTLGIGLGVGAAVAGLKSLISGTLDYASTITDLSEKMGTSAQFAQGMKFAAEQTGAEIENVSKSVLKLSQKLSGNDKGLNEALMSMGLSMQAIKTMKPEDAFNAVAAAIAKVPNPMDQARIMMDAFGKSGMDLLPAIREGMIDLADEAPKMSDATVKALDDAGDAWDKFKTQGIIATGEMVSGVMSRLDTLDTSLRSFFGFFGIEMAGQSAAARKAATAITELTDAQKKEVDQLLKNGIPANQLYDKSLGNNEASVMAYVRSLSKADGGLGKIPPVSDAAAAAALRLAEAFQKQVDVLTGKGLAREVTELARQVAAAGKQGELTAYEYAALGKRLDEMRDKGAVLPPTLYNIWLAHERLNPSIKVSTDAYAGLAAILKSLPSVKLGMPTPVDSLPIAVDPYAIIKQINRALVLAGKDTGYKLPPFPPFPPSVGQSIANSLAKSLEGIGGVIVGALQGGGNVGRSVFASIGGSMGADLGASIAKSIGGSFGKAIGGLAGPLGALAGNLLGGALDKVFGNQGRDDAKAFAQRFGGFSALRQEMLSLGAEGDRLWIALTQNSKGPAQVAATIKAIESAMAAAKQKTADMNAELGTMRSRMAELQATSEPTLKNMEDAATRLGISFDKLGPIFQQQQLTAQATEVWNAIDTLVRGGESLGSVIALSTEQLQAFSLQALKTGAAVPENFRAIYQAMLDNGTLLDENGEKLQDLSRFKFGAAVKSEWELIADEIGKLTKSIADLVLVLGGGVADAAAAAATAIRTLPKRWDIDVYVNTKTGAGAGPGGGTTPGYAGGTYGQYPDFGAGTLVTLHGRERVMTEAEGRSGGGLTIHMGGVSVRDDRDIDVLADALMDRWDRRGARG